MESLYLDSRDLQALTGTPASTWRAWARIGQGPASTKIGKRRLWRRTTVMEWLVQQEESALGTGG